MHYQVNALSRGFSWNTGDILWSVWFKAATISGNKEVNVPHKSYFVLQNQKEKRKDIRIHLFFFFLNSTSVERIWTKQFPGMSVFGKDRYFMEREDSFIRTGDECHDVRRRSAILPGSYHLL